MEVCKRIDEMVSKAKKSIGIDRCIKLKSLVCYSNIFTYNIFKIDVSWLNYKLDWKHKFYSDKTVKYCHFLIS